MMVRVQSWPAVVCVQGALSLQIVRNFHTIKTWQVKISPVLINQQFKKKLFCYLNLLLYKWSCYSHIRCIVVHSCLPYSILRTNRERMYYKKSFVICVRLTSNLCCFRIKGEADKFCWIRTIQNISQSSSEANSQRIWNQ